MSKNTTALTPEFRLSYPHLFEPKENTLSGKMEYSVTALFPKGADLSALIAAAKAATEAKWGADPKRWPKNLRPPFRKQEERAKQDENGNETLPDGYEAGAIFINLKCTKVAPKIVDRKVKPITDDSLVYAGCYGIASVNAYAYDQAGNKGVAFGLNGIQITRDGESLSGRPAVESSFKPLEDEAPDTAGAEAFFGT